jgi:hypothetical protein
MEYAETMLDWNMPARGLFSWILGLIDIKLQKTTAIKLTVIKAVLTEQPSPLVLKMYKAIAMPMAARKNKMDVPSNNTA